MNVGYDLKIDELKAQIFIKINDEICDTWEIKREDVNKALKAQQRINKAIEFINNHTHYYDDGEYSGYECEIDGLKLLSILQGEEVNNDEWGRNI